MKPVILRTGFAFVLGLGTLALPTLAEDTKPTKEKESAPNWSGYVFVSDTVGEVVKADDKSVTVRVTWLEQQAKNGGNNFHRPNLSGNHRNFHNPFAPHVNRSPQVKEHHHDYVLEYLPQSLVRTKTLPPKLDDKGKKVSHAPAEVEELRTPAGVTGYAANRSDLTPGTFVEVFLIRDKTITAAKATEDDLRIKYAVILGKDPNPPKDIASSAVKPDEKKKKN